MGGGGMDLALPWSPSGLKTKENKTKIKQKLKKNYKSPKKKSF